MRNRRQDRSVLSSGNAPNVLSSGNAPNVLSSGNAPGYSGLSQGGRDRAPLGERAKGFLGGLFGGSFKKAKGKFLNALKKGIANFASKRLGLGGGEGGDFKPLEFLQGVLGGKKTDPSELASGEQTEVEQVIQTAERESGESADGSEPEGDEQGGREQQGGRGRGGGLGGFFGAAQSMIGNLLPEWGN